MTNIETSKMSNLITDMTIAGASEDELRRAVEHSKVVMDYEKSLQVNNIAELVSKYQLTVAAKYAHPFEGSSIAGKARRLESEGKSEADIAKEMEMPLDSVRVLLKKA